VRSQELLTHAYEQIQDILRRAVDGLGAEQLSARVGPEANTVGWLAWHLLRVQDDHVADVAGVEQVWTAQRFAERFGLPFDPAATGYGFSPEEVAAVRIDSADLLLEYGQAVHAQTARFLEGLSDGDLDRVVDTRWDPPVTLGVRLVSVLADDLQHVGQAAYVRGLLAV
jgi:uncharacterized damage-inducible protein DinB